MRNKEIVSNTAISVFAFKRPGHLHACLSALVHNEEARNLDLRLYIDAPKNDSDIEAYQQVLNVCNQPWPFANVEIVQRHTNLGLFESLVSGITETLQYYESVIVIEDDIQASRFLVRYLLDGLDLYKETKQVASIHGYTPPISQKLPETFFLRGADCWGWATWRDRWKLFRHDAAAMAQEIRQRNLVKELNLNGNYDYLGMLDSRAAELNKSWAICWHASCFLENRLTLYPGQSLVRNIGLDGSGEHCGPAKAMESEASLRPIRVENIPVEVNQDVYSKYCNHFSDTKPRIQFLSAIKKRVRLKFRAIARRRNPSALALSGPYVSYQEASLRSSGYDNKVILDKVYDAVVDVLEGRSAYERDGTAFPERPPMNHMRRLLIAHLKDDDYVVDFGGGLGGSYINNRDLFSHSNNYTVVEQATFAKVGHELVLKYELKMNFVDNISNLPEKPDILIFSSVLQYIPNAIEVLQKSAVLMPRLILIDRTAFSPYRDSEKWWIQSELTYYQIPISYPIRPLSLATILNYLDQYCVVERWKNAFDPDIPPHGGVLLCRCA